MKKRIFSILLAAMISASIFAGCGTNNTDTTTAPAETTISTTAVAETTTPDTPTTTTEPATTSPVEGISITKDAAAEYLRIIENYEREYGRAQADSYMSQADFGFYYARLIDFDYNGTPELVLGYLPKNEGTAYSIYTMSNGSAVCVDTGSLFNHGGVNPSVKFAYTENEIYLITGTVQAYYRYNYCHFNGSGFETVFSYGGSYNEEYKINDTLTTEEDYNAAINDFTANIIKDETFMFEEDPSATVATIDNTKATLLANS